MNDLLGKEYYCYNIHKLPIKSSALHTTQSPFTDYSFSPLFIYGGFEIFEKA